MTISKEELRRASVDARLKLTVEAEERLLTDENKIIQQAKSLINLDLQEVKPTFYGSEQKNFLREDIEGISLKNDEALANAPESDQFYFRVPKIVEE
jgi:aspartyl-tRNA(Asn)/glutamyl-tRNA(Gln) amidotransferase subunit C